MKPNYLNVFFLLILISCTENSIKKTGSPLSLNDTMIATTSDVAMKIKMEGKVFSIEKQNLLPINVSFEELPIKFLVREVNNPVTLNLNFYQTDFAEKLPKEFKIPEDNVEKVIIDLNFFNEERNVKKMNKRIIFRNGIIKIEKFSENELKIIFDGLGSGITEKENFPISGELNINYQRT